MPYTAYITKVSTGETRIHHENHEWEGLLKSGHQSASRYWWADGNASCDCNRSHWFRRAANEDEDDDDCGDSAYRVICLDSSGTVVFNDHEPSPTCSAALWSMRPLGYLIM